MKKILFILFLCSCFVSMDAQVYGWFLNIDPSQNADTANIGIVYPTGNGDSTGRVHYVSFEHFAALIEEYISGGGGADSNMANTDLSFTGSRTYDGNGVGITYNDVDRFTLNTFGATAIQLSSTDTNSLDNTVFDIKQNRVDLVVANNGINTAVFDMSSLGVGLGHATGIYYLGDAFTTQVPTFDDATPDYNLSINSLTGRVYTTTMNLKPYTVATLPAGTAGDTAYVTDASAPTYLATVIGGGAVVCPVFFNGTNWVAH